MGKFSVVVENQTVTRTLTLCGKEYTETSSRVFSNGRMVFEGSIIEDVCGDHPGIDEEQAELIRLGMEDPSDHNFVFFLTMADRLIPALDTGADTIDPAEAEEEYYKILKSLGEDALHLPIAELEYAVKGDSHEA